MAPLINLRETDMKYLTMLALATVALNAAAATPKETYDAAKKAADTQYADDKTLCADETTSKERLQCLRDAKAEYKKAIAKAKADLTAGKAAPEPAAAKTAVPAAPAAAKAAEPCPTCGKVTSVKVDEKEGEGSALGVIAGGVAGAALGHQVGQGTGKDLATIAGAVGGAYAGHKIEGKMKTNKVWTVNVKFENGSEKSFRLEKDPGLAVGDAVKADGNGVTRR